NYSVVTTIYCLLAVCATFSKCTTGYNTINYFISGQISTTMIFNLYQQNCYGSFQIRSFIMLFTNYKTLPNTMA
ncbi:hypothetical protein, partial [Aquimarina algiphila]|uniref:hypothetical protein n=1 Tax=Aquimarina algiphila TaxID=2047982 RepID=UPI002330EE91